MCVRLKQNAERLRLRQQKAVILLLTLGSGCTKSEISQLLQRFGDCTWCWAFRWQKYSDTTAISKSFFPDVWMQWKMYFSVPSVRPCMHYNYDVISGRHASTDCLGLITLAAGHCTTCRSERELVVITFNITFLPLRLYWDKIRTCFSKDAESLTTYGCALWCSQIVYIFVLIILIQPHFTLWLKCRPFRC